MLLTGLVGAAQFANCAMLQLLGEAKNIPSDILKVVLEEGVKSDSSEAVDIIKTICVAKRFPVSEDVTNLAAARGNTEVMKILNIAPSDEEIELKKNLLLRPSLTKLQPSQVRVAKLHPIVNKQHCRPDTQVQ